MLTKNDIQYIRSLAVKKYRQKYHNYLAEGDKICSEIIREVPDQIEKLFCLHVFLTENEHILQRSTIAIEVVAEQELKKISQLKTPNNALAIMRIQDKSNLADIQCERIIYLDGVRDPGNLGTIFRSAEWFGIDLLILSPECADPYNPKVVQSAMGSLFRQPFLQLALDEFLIAQNREFFIYRAEMQGEDAFNTQYQMPSILIMGNESQGVTVSLHGRNPVSVTIPKPGTAAESLNVAVAASLLMAEMSKNKKGR